MMITEIMLDAGRVQEVGMASTGTGASIKKEFATLSIMSDAEIPTKLQVTLGTGISVLNSATHLMAEFLKSTLRKSGLTQKRE